MGSPGKFWKPTRKAKGRLPKVKDGAFLRDLNAGGYPQKRVKAGGHNGY